jgi:hypothetical protein
MLYETSEYHFPTAEQFQPPKTILIGVSGRYRCCKTPQQTTPTSFTLTTEEPPVNQSMFFTIPENQHIARMKATRSNRLRSFSCYASGMVNLLDG